MAVDSDKQDTLRQLARSYLRRLPATAHQATIRFDVVSIYLESPNAEPSHIELNQGAFGWA
jgi:Holliday junction resolvase-like predicted endonuclease